MPFHYCITGRLLAASLFSTLAIGQSPNVNGLLSEDWRERNATAKKLLKDPATRNQDLLRVLNTTWRGHTPKQGMGGAGWFNSGEPRAQTMRSVNKEVGYNWPITAARHPQTSEELVGPWHPHKLATLLLLERGSSDGLEDLQPTDTNRSRIWVRCCKPTDEEIAAALADAKTAEPVLFATLPRQDNRANHLRNLIANGPPSARRAALRQAGKMPFDDVLLRATIEQLMTDRSSAYTRNAAHHLRRSGKQAAKLLAEHFEDGRKQRHLALAVLCVMEEQAEPAARELLTCLQHDVTSQRRALVALSNFEQPEALQAEAANQIMALLEKTRSRIVRVLAVDALATCGKGVTESQRTRLHALLLERKFLPARARLLAALKELDAVPELELDALAKIAKGPNHHPSLWSLLADHGEKAGPVIIEHELFHRAVGDRLADTAPDMLVRWLDADSAQQEVALPGLLNKRPELVSSERLAGFLGATDKVAAIAFAELCERPEATKHKALLLQYANQRGYLNDQAIAHLRRLVPSFTKLTETFGEHLKKGKLWDLVLGLDDVKLRELTWTWLQQTEDTNVRDDLLAQLIKLGVRSGREIQLVEEALRAGECSSVVRALYGGELPAQLIPALEDLCDIPPTSDWWSEDWYARECLIALHR